MLNKTTQYNICICLCIYLWGHSLMGKSVVGDLRTKLSPTDMDTKNHWSPKSKANSGYPPIVNSVSYFIIFSFFFKKINFYQSKPP